jgi:hypothetical protein
LDEADSLAYGISSSSVSSQERDNGEVRYGKLFTWFKTETKVITIVTAIKQKNTKSREKRCNSDISRRTT